jgi:hypothetical protein
VYSKIVPALALAGLVLWACSPAATPSASDAASPTATVAAAKSAKPDIVAPNSGVTIGPGWYGYETFGGQKFRWVGNMATFSVAPAPGGTRTVSFDVEAGPGIGTPTFTLHVLDRSGNDVASASVAGHERVSFNLPAHTSGDTTYELHADGGGKSAPKDKRILNFRVFAIDDRPAPVVATADIVAQGDVHVGKNWDVLEQYQGQTFRWVANDAEITVDASSNGTKNLLVDVAAGPAVESPNDFALDLQDASGKTVQTRRVKAIGSASFTLALHKGSNTFRLHVASTGQPAKTDKRVLSFRVFKLRVT